MPQFKYTAIDGNGKERRGTIEAKSSDEASSKLAGSGLMVTEMAQAEAKAKAGPATAKKKSGGLSFLSKIKQEDLTLFTRQLATLLKSGVPLLRAIEVMERQEKNPKFAGIIGSIADNVRSGNTFSDGLSQYPRVFDHLYVNMVRAGEAGGVLETVLDRLAVFMEKSLKTKKKVKSAMIYPSVVITVAVLIVVMLLLVVVPKFEQIFEEMLGGAALPGITQFVIDSSRLIQTNVVMVVIVVVAGFFGIKFALKTPLGSKVVDWLVLRIPKLGDVLGKANIARFTRTLGTLLSSGVPILDALVITRDIVSNHFYSTAISRIHDQVRDGESVATPMSNEPVFPSMVTSMVEVGEETGELPEMLGRVADTYDDDVDNAVAGITSIIEPIMIVFLAVVVGFIVIALFLPIIKIIETLT